MHVSSDEYFGSVVFCSCSTRPLEVFCKIPVSQVACGSQHSVALTKSKLKSGEIKCRLQYYREHCSSQGSGDVPTDGQVYTWGLDSRGQLGLGNRRCSTSSPRHLQFLSAIPLVQIAAGGEQSFALSVSGGVFGWGRNDCGQLGLGDETGTVKTIHVSCGKDHSAILTKDGVVFTFGSGQYGQLGHNSMRKELRPRLVAELWGAKVTKIACGRYSTPTSFYTAVCPVCLIILNGLIKVF
uniref:Uncharacterized protein n=1 Tax=Monopterus albus TaxID=43700 RepID=A0A3Q3IRJ6_MONAL